MESAIAGQLLNVAGWWTSELAERARSDVQSRSEWRALNALASATGSVIQTELARQMGIRGPTLVRLLDELESQGLVRRQSVPGDRRAKHVVLECRGRAIVEGIEAASENLRGEMFAGLSDAELAAGVRLLSQVCARIAS